MSGRDPSNEEVMFWARWLAGRPENIGKSWEELIDSAYQLIVDMNQRSEDTRLRRYCERTGYITAPEEAALLVTGDDHKEDALERLSALMDFLRAPSDELTDLGREYRDQWMTLPELSQLPDLLRIHAPGQLTRAFCSYLRDTVFPKWKLIERRKVKKT